MPGPKARWTLLFSTHNRDQRHFDRLPWQEGLSFDLNFIKNCVHALSYLPKHLSLKTRGASETSMQSSMTTPTVTLC